MASAPETVHPETARLEARADRARETGAIYGLLARLYRREPDRQLVDDLRDPGVLRNLVEAGMAIDEEEFLAPPADLVAESLARDYTVLFFSPDSRIPLNESVHRPEDGSLLGESTVEVGRLIRSLGISIDERWSGLPDHLSIELEIMQRLAETEAVHRASHRTEVAETCAARQRSFLNDHLAAWVPGLCDTIEAQASTVFYQALARLTRAFIQQQLSESD
jgi:TorA maturation chaperone TorD